MGDSIGYLWPWDGNLWLSFICLGLAGAQILVRRLPEGQAFASRVPWSLATVNLILAPLTAGALGYFLFQLASALGSVRVAETISVGASFVVALSLAGAVGRLVELWLLSRQVGEETALPELERNLLYGFALFVGSFAYLVDAGHSPAELYLSTGALAAIVAFGMQQTLGDLFSGIALSIERPFRPGDWLTLSDGTEGQVTDINWRATRLRGWDNATHVIPNSVLARQGFKNLHGHRHVYAPWYLVRIPGEVDPRVAKALLLEAALRCSRVMGHPLPVIRLSDASTVPYTYMVWVHFQNYPAMFAGREELFREIHYALRRAGIQAAPSIEEIHHRQVAAVTVDPPSAQIALQGLDLANVLSEQEITRVAAMSQRQFHDAGTVLLREGEITDSFNVLVSGVVEAGVVLGNGGRKIVERLRPGDYFGITSMLANEPASLEFQAASDVTVLRVDIACLRSVLSDRPDLADAFAEIVQRRMQLAEEAREAANRPVPHLTLQDLVRRIEISLGLNSGGP